jgi:hypothetical protein
VRRPHSLEELPAPADRRTGVSLASGPNARDAPEPAPGVPPKSSAGEGSTTASSGDTQLPGLYTQCEYPGIQYVGANVSPQHDPRTPSTPDAC